MRGVSRSSVSPTRARTLSLFFASINHHPQNIAQHNATCPTWAGAAAAGQHGQQQEHTLQPVQGEAVPRRRIQSIGANLYHSRRGRGVVLSRIYKRQVPPPPPSAPEERVGPVRCPLRRHGGCCRNGAGLRRNRSCTTCAAAAVPCAPSQFTHKEQQLNTVVQKRHKRDGQRRELQHCSRTGKRRCHALRRRQW